MMKSIIRTVRTEVYKQSCTPWRAASITEPRATAGYSLYKGRTDDHSVWKSLTRMFQYRTPGLCVCICVIHFLFYDKRITIKLGYTG